MAMSLIEPNTVHCVDCMEGLKEMPDNYVDLAIVDPPYGRGEAGGRSRTHAAVQKNGTKSVVRGEYQKKDWDTPPGASYFFELFRVSEHQIVWGCNYQAAIWDSGRIVWDKCNDGAAQSGCEIAFCSKTERVDLFRFMWRGMMQGSGVMNGGVQQGNKQKNEKRVHPTQKPVDLYKWLLQNYAKEGDLILDTHMGSGSSYIACLDMGFDYIGYEIDEDYFEAIEARTYQFTRQETLF